MFVQPVAGTALSAETRQTMGGSTYMDVEYGMQTTLRRPRVHSPAQLSHLLKHPSTVVAAILALCFLLFFRELGSRELWASHEARAVQNAQGMLDEGNWLLPRLMDGQAELQKPPAFYWLVALCGVARGSVDPIAARLPAAIAGTLCALAIWAHLHARRRPVAAFIAASALAAAVHFTGTARVARIDVPLACVVTASLLVSRSTNRQRIVWMGLLIGAAFLLKGLIGVALPMATLGITLVIERQPIRKSIRNLAAIGLIAALVGLPWFLWVNHETGGELFRVFVVYHHINRAFGGAESLATHPVWFYLPRFVADFLPWSPLVFAAILMGRWRNDADAKFGLIWLAVMFALLSASRFKRADYLIPAYPGAAILLGCTLETWLLSRSHTTKVRCACVFSGILVLIPIGWFAFDRLVTDREQARHQQSDFAVEIRRLAPAPARSSFSASSRICSPTTWDDPFIRWWNGAI